MQDLHAMNMRQAASSAPRLSRSENYTLPIQQRHNISGRKLWTHSWQATKRTSCSQYELYWLQCR